MRAVLAIVLASTLGGCVAFDPEDEMACDPTVVQKVGDASWLGPQEAAALLADPPALQAHALRGQIVTARAVWQAAAGDVRVAYEGPTNVETSTPTTWGTVALAQADGPVSLQLWGDPAAGQVRYVLQLTIVGCADADGPTP